MKRRLKKLELLGFKSFADKTSLDFNEGITCIVGPNGCGKSNIADAFRWVLGEQSAKSMRGAKMPDVIFSGTSHRSPLNFAEVTITLSNEDGLLPLSYQEIAITRRLHRNGESDYFINRNSVRLKDLQDLFLDAGVGKNAFAIFEQGKIDQVIQYSPLERRYIFEDAAGIVKFLQRKRESLRKMEQVDQNISRAKDIYQEVEKQITLLEEQSKKAIQYKQHKSNFEACEQALIVFKWKNCCAKNQELKKRKEAQSLETILQDAKNIELEFQNKKEQIKACEQHFLQCKEEMFQAKNKKEILIQEKVSQENRLKEGSSKEMRWKNEMDHLFKKKEQREIEKKGIQQLLKELDSTLIEASKGLGVQKEKTLLLEKQVNELRDRHTESQKEKLQNIQMENSIESELKQNKIRQEAIVERKKAAVEKNSKLILSIQTLNEQTEEKRNALEFALKSVESKKRTLELITQKISEANKEIGSAKNSIEKIKNEMSEAKARHKALERLSQDKEGFSNGSKKLLQESENPQSSLYNKLKPIYSFFNIQEEFSLALSEVLRNYSHTLVVETQKELDAVLEFAEQNKLKDFSLFCLEHIQKEKDPVSSLSLSNKVDSHPIGNHFLRNVLLVDTFKAKQTTKTNTQTMFWIGNRYFQDNLNVIFSSSSNENNVFSRENEIKQLEKRIALFSQNLAKAEENLKQLVKIRDHEESEKTSLDKNLRKEEMSLVEINFTLQRFVSDLSKANNEKSQLSSDLLQCDAMLEKIETTIADLSKKLIIIKEKEIQFATQFSAIQSELDKSLSSLRREREILNEKEMAYRKHSEEQKKKSHELHILEVQNIEGQKQEKRLSEELQMSNELHQQIKSKGQETEIEILDAEKKLKNSIEACQKGERKIDLEKKQLEAIELKRTHIQDKKMKMEEELLRIEMQMEQTVSSIKDLSDMIQEKYALSIEDAVNKIPESSLPKSVDALEKQMKKLRMELESSGDVNMTAIEECEKNRTRYSFLKQQIEDLESSKKELVHIISELDEESRKKFKETFNAISKNFKKNFQILFNGGEADLQFTEASDVLDAGIEIIAKPPGKQMRSISLMSGGEKCLTAMALLFAIFEEKPAPFCILDEIDAPLDDSNVERFVKVLRQFIDRCQFIIITHNKRTMGIADKLCGVSMQEKGVSKMLTMEFSTQQVLAEVL